MDPELDVQVTDGICRITFCRPEALNALTGAMATGLVDALHDARTAEEVRVVVLTGQGGAFSAGADLQSADRLTGYGARALDIANAMVRGIVTLDKPVVAAVNGVAAGVGASLCFAADLAVTSESAAFLLAFSRIGLMPDGGSSLTVAASAGRAKAMRMALLGEPLTAREAYDAGLVSHVVPDTEFSGTVDKIARRLAGGPPIAFAATKKAVNAATLPALEEVLERERTGQVVLMGTADAQEGMRAFAEKRRPVFTGR